MEEEYIKKTNVPTYEEYLKFSPFERLRFKYGLFIMIGVWICIITLFFYTYLHVDELSDHPLTYCAEKFGLNCFCQNFEERKNYNFNSTSVYITSMLRG
jgi:hypothetical protein|tara:strand:- start:14836 stop:15132 length:297 start_codon:yes stop_codon:yes gene_type:complete